VEYGEPIRLTKELVQSYKVNKRVACQTLLSHVEEGMRSVIVTAGDYNELKLLHTVRRLYVRSPVGLSTHVRQDLSRRFSTAYRLIREKYGGTLPPELLELQERIQQYQTSLDSWGLKDYQVPQLHGVAYSKALFAFLHGLSVFLLASLPSILLNAPVGYAAKYWAESQARKDLKRSRVKVQARDVILSKKIMFCLVAVPVLWVLYAVLLLTFTSLKRQVVLAMFLAFPVFSYFGVTAVEAGMVDLKDIRPFFLRLLPGFKQQAEQLPLIRAELVKDVRQMVRKYGPELGPVYYEKGFDWEKSLKQTVINNKTD
jgi:glycerol-3-phosphate O-acyltransferase/dihydroxyacetone phosphate acyltransferase